MRSGLARRRVVAQTTRAAKQLYSITAPGRRALTAWLETVEPGATQSFYLKLFVGGLTTPGVLREHVQQFRADTAERLVTYREIEKTNTNRGYDWYHHPDRARHRARGARPEVGRRRRPRTRTPPEMTTATTSWTGRTCFRRRRHQLRPSCACAAGTRRSRSARAGALRGKRLRFSLPGLPQDVVFAGTVSNARLSGSVRQGRLRGTFALRRGAAPLVSLLGFYSSATKGTLPCSLQTACRPSWSSCRPPRRTESAPA